LLAFHLLCAGKNGVSALDRYLAEFDYHYNTRKIKDSERMVRAAGGGEASGVSGVNRVSGFPTVI
jgi:hypothetical protein